MSSGSGRSVRVAATWLAGIAVLSLAVLVLMRPDGIAVEIQADPQGARAFLLETRIIYPGIHGADVNKIDERYVATNERVVVPADLGVFGSLFGRVAVSALHPEYRQADLSKQGYRGDTMTLTPQTWLQATETAQLELSTPPLSERSSAEYIELAQSGKLLRLAELQYHVWSVRERYLPGLDDGARSRLVVSLDVLRRVIDRFTAAATGAGGDDAIQTALTRIDADMVAIADAAP